jgi:hypothetical protein
MGGNKSLAGALHDWKHCRQSIEFSGSLRRERISAGTSTRVHIYYTGKTLGGTALGMGQFVIQHH